MVLREGVKAGLDTAKKLDSRSAGRKVIIERRRLEALREGGTSVRGDRRVPAAVGWARFSASKKAAVALPRLSKP